MDYFAHQIVASDEAVMILVADNRNGRFNGLKVALFGKEAVSVTAMAIVVAQLKRKQ